MSNQTTTLTTNRDTIAFTGNDNRIYAASGTVSTGDDIVAGTGPNDILYLTGAGTFDLTAPTTLTGIQIVDGDATDDQTIILRAGLPVTVNLGGGNDTVTIADSGDVVRGGAGTETINAGTDLLGATIDGGGGGFGSLNITGGTATQATLGSTVTDIHYINVFATGFALDVGAVDAPVIYITGDDGATTTDDTVTPRFAGQSVTDYTGGNTIDFAGGDETLTMSYVADGTSQPADTLTGFDATDTIDLPDVNFNDPNLDVNAYLAAPDTLTVTIDNETTNVETTQTFNLSGLFVGGTGFQAQADGNDGTEIVYSGAVFTPPANPTPTQTIYWVPPAADDGGSLIESDGTEADTSVLYANTSTLQGVGFTTTNNSGSDRTDVVAGGKLYLLQAGLVGAALYVSDGTADGTTLVADLGGQQTVADNSLGGAGSSGLAFLTVAHTGTTNDARFNSFTTDYTVTLWTSDGSAAGTSALARFASTDDESSPTAVYEGTSQGQYYFAVTVGAGDDQLWATNAAGTAVSEIADLGVDYQPSDFHAVASGGIWWSENGNLYHSDGTAAGTDEELSSGPYVGDLVVEGVVGTYDGAAVFAFGFYGTGNTVYLGTYDGQRLTDLGSFDNSSVEVGYDAAVQVGGNLVLSVDDTDMLYVSDGTSALTAVTPAGLPSGTSFLPFDLGIAGNSVMLNGLLYFFGYVDNGGTLTDALYSTDGTAAGTRLVDDFQMAAGSVSQLIVADGTLYFTAMLGGGTYLMRSDGTDPSYPVSSDGNMAFYDPGGLITGPLTPDTPAPAPVDIALTTGVDAVIGTPYDDTFTATDGTLNTGDSIIGDGGLDKLVLSGGGTFDLSAPATLLGISEVDARVGGVSGSTQTITLRAGTDMIVRISGSSAAYTVNGADNSDTIIGTSGETFAGAYSTTVTIGGANETIDVAHAIVRTSSANAGALIIGPSRIVLTDATAPIVLNANDQLSGGRIVLAGASTISVGGGGNFAFDNDTPVYETTGGNTISLGNNGNFTIFAAGSGGDTITEGYTLANYALIGAAAELNDDTIYHFDVSHVVSYIDIIDMEYSLASRDYSDGVLTVRDGTHTDTFTIPIAGATTGSFTLSYDGSDGTIVTATCYAAGSRILTPAGEVAVETLLAGDPVTTADGTARPVRWVGRRRIDLARHPRPALVQPIRIRAGAVAEGVPRRDLLVSPDHAVVIDGALIPARLLVNGASIVRETGLDEVVYFHVELDRHDLLLAEGLAAESYLDTGNRAMFETGGACVTLHPDLAGMALAVAPELVAPRWQALAARAGAGAPPGVPEEAGPTLCVVAAGRTLMPVEIVGERHVFALPRRCEAVRLVSPAASPAALAPWHDDRRVLGVCVARLALHGADGVRELAMDDPALDGAFWPAERDAARIWRWTDGDAALRVPAGTRLLEVTLAGPAAYPVRERQAA